MKPKTKHSGTPNKILGGVRNQQKRVRISSLEVGGIMGGLVLGAKCFQKKGATNCVQCYGDLIGTSNVESR